MLQPAAASFDENHLENHMTSSERTAPIAPTSVAPESPLKGRGGARRLVNALRYSLAGWRAAWRHEAAFRQEVLVGVPLIVLALWRAPNRWQALLLVGSVVFVWLVELLNSAVEALADAVSPHPHALLGRAKDQASAAVMLSLLLSAAAWAVVFWPYPISSS